MTLSRVTRGKTRAGRLSLLDPWLARLVVERGLCRVVDVGPGARPDTTVELHRALSATVAGVETAGIDVDADRVAALVDLDEPGITGVVGGFDHRFDPPVDLVRAANVLRQYRLDQVGPSLRAMGRWLRPGGWLVEGTTDKVGERGCFRVIERVGWELQSRGLVFLTHPQRGFHPRALTPYLPRGLGWHGHPGPAVAQLFEAWSATTDRLRGDGVSEALMARSAAEVGAEVGAGWVFFAVDGPGGLNADLH